MVTQTKRTTVYLDPDLHKALRMKAAAISRTVSDLINEAVRESVLEDAEDYAAFEERDKEPLISYDAMVRRLRKDGRL